MLAVKQMAVLDSGSSKPPINTIEPGTACIANISPDQRRKRFRFGMIMAIISLTVLIALLLTGVNQLWRLPLLPLFMSAAIGFFQWNDKTCIAFARIDSRKLGDTIETIDDPAELAQVHRQARQIVIKAFLAAVVVTLIALVLP